MADTNAAQNVANSASPPQPQIVDVRRALMDTISDLRNKDNPMELERAKTIAQVAQTIINSAKAETDFLATVGQRQGSGFIPQPEKPVQPAAALPAPVRAARM